MRGSASPSASPRCCRSGVARCCARDATCCSSRSGRSPAARCSRRDALEAKGWSVGVINARFVKPLDRQLILDQARGKSLVVTFEESVVTGGFGSAVLEAFEEARLADPAYRSIPVRTIGIPGDRFVDHGSVTDLRRLIRLDVPGLVEQVEETLAQLGVEAPAAEARLRSGVARAATRSAPRVRARMPRYADGDGDHASGAARSPARGARARGDARTGPGDGPRGPGQGGGGRRRPGRPQGGRPGRQRRAGLGRRRIALGQPRGAQAARGARRLRDRRHRPGRDRRRARRPAGSPTSCWTGAPSASTRSTSATGSSPTGSGATTGSSRWSASTPGR